jgi:cysteine-rich repeat protein
MIRVRPLFVVAFASFVAGSGCSDSLANSVCGNGEIESGEFCDDGNTSDGDGCAHDCLIERDVGGADASAGDPDAGEAVPDAAVPFATVINEYVFGHLGTDVNEFIEVLGAPNTDLSNLTLIVIEGDATASGLVDFVRPLGTTDAEGFHLVGSLAQDSLENGSQTLLLVEGFSGTAGMDIDPTTDGTADLEPWTKVVDAIAISDGGATDLFYLSAPVVSQLAASRIPDGTDTNLASDWRPNDINGEGLACCSDGTPPAIGSAFHTPGASNSM